MCSAPPPPTVGTLCVQLLQQLFDDLSETLQVFLAWSEDVHVVSDIILRLIFVTFYILNLAIFQARILSKGIDNGYLVSATPRTVLCQSF